MHDFRRGIIHAPERPNTALFVLGLFGAGLVAAGVSGEFWKESQIATVETCIRKGNDALFLLLSKEAGDAAASAKAAHEELGAVKSQAKELTDRLANATRQLDTVDAKRAALDKTLRDMAVCNSPRVLIGGSVNGKDIIDPLKPFAGRHAIIEFIIDAEAYRAARGIANALTMAGWKVDWNPILDFGNWEKIPDGVEIQRFKAPLPDPKFSSEWNSLWQAELHSDAAATALVDFLHSFSWQANLGYPHDEKGKIIRDPKIFQPDTLRVRVGLYPAIPFVSSSATKEFAEGIVQFEKEREKLHKQTESEMAQETEETAKRLPPDKAKAYRALRQQLKQEYESRVKQTQEPYIQPCQPLESLVPRR